MLFHAGTLTGCTDGQLLERFVTGGGEVAEHAFSSLIDRHGPMVWRVCCAILRDEHDAQDAFQATFLVLVQRAGSLWVRDSLGPWLHRVASRAAVRARVVARRRRSAERRAVEMARRVGDDPIGDDLGGLIHEAIDRLPDRYRVPVVLCDLEGRSYEEAARHLRCPVGTIKSRLARGRERLRDRLARHGLAVLAGLPAGPGIGIPEASPAPAALMAATVRATTALATRGAVGGGAFSASVVSLARGVSMNLFLQKMRSVVTIALLAATAAIGGGLFLKAATARRGAAPAAPRRAAAVQRAEEPSEPLLGVVRDEAGRPVAGATVVAGQFKGTPNHRITETGPDGRFRLTPGDESAILEYVLAYKEGLAPASSGHIKGVDKPGEVALMLTRTAPFEGVVKDREGKPIAGASVRLEYAHYSGSDGPETQLTVLGPIVVGTPLERIFRTKTLPHGQFRFMDVPRGARVSLVVTSPGMGEYNTMNHRGPDGKFVYLAGKPEAPAEVILAPAARVVGRVLTRLPGVKVDGLKVFMQGSRDSGFIWEEAQTDAGGRFEFAGLGEGTANIFLTDQPNDGPWTYRAAADTALKPGQPTEVTIELIRGVQVEGLVVVAETGEPLAECDVALYGPIRPRSGAAVVSTRTDKEGRYRFRLPPGETYFYPRGPFPPGYPRFPGGLTVAIPADVTEFQVPKIEVRKGAPGR
jgi:RNA polymerase sigma factor (sigma-70 family)